MPFAKHETFHIREGWLFKGMDAICRDPTIFLAKDASERLGLGKNMVRALRFWMTSTGLAEEYQEDQRTHQRLTVPFCHRCLALRTNEFRPVGEKHTMRYQ